MPIGWFIVPYKRILPYNGPFLAGRYCAMDDYTKQIKADGGDWREMEILGNRAIVKVQASAETLTVLASVFKRLPKDRLDDTLADLPLPVRRALRDEMQDQGYTLQAIQARFGSDMSTFTLRDILRFMASRRRKVRYDANTDELVFDGDEISLPADKIDELDLGIK